MQALSQRVAKHLRLNWRALGGEPVKSPPFLILFINSLCNMKCEHCFYWTSLNKRDDLSFEEIEALSKDLGRIENLNLSGGEPFLRKEFAEICKLFIDNNGVEEIYVPSNGYYPDRTIKALREVLKSKTLRLFVVELSLDGMPAFHDEFRKTRNSFRKSMETYDALVELQKEDPRLKIHAISTATDQNMAEIRQLTTFLYDRCPKMSHHNLAIIRGDRKNPSLKGPALQAYRELYDYVRRLWAPREEERYGSVVEPMLQHVKMQTAEREEQVAPCRAGVLTGVVYANGDVGVCEQRDPIGNLRQNSFMELWTSHVAKEARRSIACKECYCTNEIFMWPSIVFQPTSLASGLVGAKVWNRATPLPASERVDYSAATAPLNAPLRRSQERELEPEPEPAE
jgi:MoaA/NifB/PqqE/SkfB family radical SAM enzyme